MSRPRTSPLSGESGRHISRHDHGCSSSVAPTGVTATRMGAPATASRLTSRSTAGLPDRRHQQNISWVSRSLFRIEPRLPGDPLEQVEQQRIHGLDHLALQLGARGHPSTGRAKLFHVGRTHAIFGAMAKKPDRSPKAGKSVKSGTGRSGAAHPEVQPIGPALAELLNPAINRGESGIGSSTGLQPPPDNSWDRRAGGEAAAHRARASTPRVCGEVPCDPGATAAASEPAAGGRALGIRASASWTMTRTRAPREGLSESAPGQLRHLRHHPDARSGTGAAARPADRRG